MARRLVRDDGPNHASAWAYACHGTQAERHPAGLLHRC